MKVFLVDDEIVIREGVRDSFPWDDTPYQLVGEAPDGEMALPMIRDTNPDIVITDIRMPFMDGMELCRALRTQMPWIGIIILSGFDEFEYARQAIQLGVREYLLKPISAEDLKQALDRVREKLNDERQTRGLRQRIENERGYLREKLVGSLFSDDAMETDAEDTIRQLHAMGCPAWAACYQVIDAAFQPIRVGQAAANELAESSGGAVLTSGGRSGTRLMVLGDTTEDTEERAYAFASSLARELERAGCQEIRIGIGESAQGSGGILKSFQSARRIRRMLMDRGEAGAVILGARELGESMGERKTPNVINEAKVYMSRRFTDPNLMLQDVARAVNMSNSRFSTVFSQQSGRTFTEYLTYLRLNRAKELLRTTDMPVSQIALEAGYSDGHYFSYIFKKNVGMTPGEYRGGK